MQWYSIYHHSQTRKYLKSCGQLRGWFPLLIINPATLQWGHDQIHPDRCSKLSLIPQLSTKIHNQIEPTCRPFTLRCMLVKSTGGSAVTMTHRNGFPAHPWLKWKKMTIFPVDFLVIGIVMDEYVWVYIYIWMCNSSQWNWRLLCNDFVVGRLLFWMIRMGMMTTPITH